MEGNPVFPRALEYICRESGMLLYAKTEEAITPDCSYVMSGNKISVKTLDLNKEFKLIAAQLDKIAEEYFQKM